VHRAVLTIHGRNLTEFERRPTTGQRSGNGIGYSDSALAFFESVLESALWIRSRSPGESVSVKRSMTMVEEWLSDETPPREG
jgi:hypothetical protein